MLIIAIRFGSSKKEAVGEQELVCHRFVLHLLGVKCRQSSLETRDASGESVECFGPFHLFSFGSCVYRSKTSEKTGN